MIARAIITLAALSLITACAPILTGTANVDDALKVMQAQDARGCIYLKGKAQPWADVTLMVVGTWGAQPPAYKECWTGLPTQAP